MRQLTLRLPDALVEQLRGVATARGESLNAYASAVLSAATDPTLEDDAALRVRERLARAGLLATFPEPAPSPPAEEAVAAARRAAGRGTPLSELVREGRG